MTFVVVFLEAKGGEGFRGHENNFPLYKYFVISVTPFLNKTKILLKNYPQKHDDFSDWDRGRAMNDLRKESIYLSSKNRICK